MQATPVEPGVLSILQYWDLTGNGLVSDGLAHGGVFQGGLHPDEVPLEVILPIPEAVFGDDGLANACNVDHSPSARTRLPHTYLQFHERIRHSLGSSDKA